MAVVLVPGLDNNQKRNYTLATISHATLRILPTARAGMTALALGTAMMTGGMSVARAESPAGHSFQLAQANAPTHPAAAGATETKGETVEQRIASLQKALKITSDQDGKWNAVAQAMRQNETAMEKLIAETKAMSPRSISAVEDLNIYRKFAQAHVDGLKNLIDDFKVLYDSMPAAQKETADAVFKTTRG